MTAPTRTRASAARTSPSEREQAPERTRTRANPRVRARSAAAERAYARREERGQRAGRAATESNAGKPRQSAAQRPSSRQPQAKAAKARPRQSQVNKAKRFQTRITTSRAPFVVAVMVVLAAGIASTLWLSIAAVGNSYELQNAEERVNALSERKETLLEQVSTMSSTPVIQQRARELGMVPGSDPAHLVVHQDGSVTVIGEPKAAKAPAPPPAPAPGREAPSQPSRQASPAPAVGQQP